MNNRQELLKYADLVVLGLQKQAQSALWKYVDGDGKEFFLPEKITGSLHSPYSGRSFSARPYRLSLADVSKELRQAK